jgi:serine/threonine protein kinase
MQSSSAEASCPNDDALCAYVEGRLPEAERARLEDHVDACAACGDVLEAYGRSYARAPSAHDDSRARDVARLQKMRVLAPGIEVGRFRVLERVGEGAVGVVYAAHDPKLDRKVALKLMPSDREESLAREARAMARLAHPNVVAVYDVGRFEDRVFIAMEFVRGATLRAWLGAEKRSEAAILRAFLEAGRGLAAAHAAGLAHRDFKPENVLVGEDGRVRVGDFGLARAVDAVTTPAGTPAYMAPEQRGGHAADTRSDQYSFCVALHEALTGALPPAPGAPVPARIRKILARGLARPEERYASMDELLADLSRRPRRALGVAAAALALGCAALVYAKGWHARAATPEAAPPEAAIASTPLVVTPSAAPVANAPEPAARPAAPARRAPPRVVDAGAPRSAASYDPGSYQ